MQNKGPFHSQYLDHIINVLERALDAHPRTLAIRFDLHIPKDMIFVQEDRLMDRFVSSLKRKIKWARYRASRRSSVGRAHHSDVRYVWAKEYGRHGEERPHYHFVLFLNRDAFRAMGRYQVGRDNLYSRILEAWASALRQEPDDLVGLLHVPANALYPIDYDDLASQDKLFHRASYLAKAATKRHSSRHSFGASRL